MKRLIYIIILLLLIACRKQPINSEHDKYLGTWLVVGTTRGCNTAIRFYEDGFARYSSFGLSMECDFDVEGKGKYDKDRIYIDKYGFKIISGIEYQAGTMYHHGWTYKVDKRMTLKKPLALMGDVITLYHLADKIPDQ